MNITPRHVGKIIFLIIFSGINIPLALWSWNPPEWNADESKTPMENLIDLLTGLEEAASASNDHGYLESHYASMKLLLEAYPPSTVQTEGLINAFMNPVEGGGPFRYGRGERPLVLAYESSVEGVVSYVTYSLPSRWNAQVEYPVYVWARGGSSTPYPGDIYTVFDKQINQPVNEPFPGLPSSVFKDGYTVMPGALGGRAYTGEQQVDFIDGLDLFLSHYKTDETRYYLGGFSGGGRAAYMIGAPTVHRYNWAALGMAAPAVTQNLNAEYAAPLVNTPVWIIVGANDSSWIGNTRNVRDVLIEIGNPPVYYHEEPGVGHNWTWDFQKGMYDFFKTQQYIAPTPPPADLKIIRDSESGAFMLIIEALDSFQARLEVSEDMMDWQWQEDLDLAANDFYWGDYISPSEKRFYRLVR